MGNLSTVRSLSELDKDDPVREGGRQEGSDKKQLEKVVLFFPADSYGIRLYKKQSMPKMRLFEFSFFCCKNELKFCDF